MLKAVNLSFSLNGLRSDTRVDKMLSARAVLQVAVDAQGTVVGVTKRKESGIEPMMMMEMIGLAQKQGILLHAPAKLSWTSLHQSCCFLSF